MKFNGMLTMLNGADLRAVHGELVEKTDHGLMTWGGWVRTDDGSGIALGDHILTMTNGCQEIVLMVCPEDAAKKGLAMKFEGRGRMPS